MDVGGIEYLDKIPVKRVDPALGVRVVPPGVARYGSFLSEGVVLMPGYVNIGAWVGPRDDGRHLGHRRLVRADRRGRPPRRRGRYRRGAGRPQAATGDRRERRVSRLALCRHRGRPYRRGRRAVRERLVDRVGPRHRRHGNRAGRVPREARRGQSSCPARARRRSPPDLPALLRPHRRVARKSHRSAAQPQRRAARVRVAVELRPEPSVTGLSCRRRSAPQALPESPVRP